MKEANKLETSMEKLKRYQSFVISLNIATKDHQSKQRRGS